MKLIKPTAKYGRSFRKSFLEMKKRNEQTIYGIWDITTTAKKYIAAAKKHERGKDLPKGWVSHSAYWLIDKDVFVGEVQIRHKLSKHLRKIGGHIGYLISPFKRRKGYGKKILALALKKAKQLGIKKVLITCEATNIGSKKIIEANGGIFEKTTNMGRGKSKKLLYWINLS
jgi:predicted acetyltransferase